MSIMITDTQKQQYHDEGYMILENIIPKDHLQMLRDECTRYIAEIDADMTEKGVDKVGLNHRGKRYFIANKYKESGKMASFIFSDLMANICRAALGDDAFLFLDQFVVKMAEVGMSFSWHQDAGYIDHQPIPPYVSCWCALDDVNEENGTIYVLPYSVAGTKEWIKHTIDEETNDRVGYHGDHPGIPVIVPAGSIAVFSSLTLHRSGANTTKKPRRSLLVQYSAAPITNPDGALRHWAEPFVKNGQKVVVEA